MCRRRKRCEGSQYEQQLYKRSASPDSSQQSSPLQLFSMASSDPTAPMATVDSSPNFNFGYPTPGIQQPTGSQVMDHIFFLTEDKWKQVREVDDFDYVVIGSGFCALGFVSQVLKSRPDARILVLERGPFFLPEHFQNLPLPFQQAVGGMSETFPWTLSSKTMNSHPPHYIKWQHGMVPFFGGRSTTWSGWCPRPTKEEMSGWPEEVISAANSYFSVAEELLHVTPSSDIGNCRNEAVYGNLQSELKLLLDSKAVGCIESVTRITYAPLAVRDPHLQGLDYSKFSTVGPLMSQAMASPNVKILTNCVVSRVIRQGRTPTALDTSRGVVSLGNAKLILAMGTLPPTTLVLNSFPELTNVGKRFTSHFITSVVARVPCEDYDFLERLDSEKLELSAIYVAGVDPRNREAQYHIQLTALYDPDPVRNAGVAFRYMPDVVATASQEQLSSSKGYVVFVCATLGELESKNPNSWLKKTSDGSDPTTNVLLQIKETKSDLELWDVMDESVFQVVEVGLSPHGKDRVEYWDNTTSKWVKKRPSRGSIRVPALVHEGSTMHIGKEADAVVNLDYSLKGVDNVYVTGGSLWPKSGSWNPTMTMVALSQHLADNLESAAA